METRTGWSVVVGIGRAVDDPEELALLSRCRCSRRALAAFHPHHDGHCERAPHSEEVVTSAALVSRVAFPVVPEASAAV